MSKYRAVPILLLIFFSLMSVKDVIGQTNNHNNTGRNHKSLMKKAAWAGAGLAVGRVAGPPGSLGLGTFRYRHDLRAGGHSRNRALFKIGAPVAASAAFGPAGTVGYQVIAHRHWIKHHLLPHHFIKI